LRDRNFHQASKDDTDNPTLIILADNKIIAYDKNGVALYTLVDFTGKEKILAMTRASASLMNELFFFTAAGNIHHVYDSSKLAMAEKSMVKSMNQTREYTNEISMNKEAEAGIYESIVVANVSADIADNNLSVSRMAYNPYEVDPKIELIDDNTSQVMEVTLAARETSTSLRDYLGGKLRACKPGGDFPTPWMPDENSCPANLIYVIETDSCECKAGFFLADDGITCEPPTVVRINDPGRYPECDEGFILDNDGITCIEPTVIVTADPGTNPECPENTLPGIDAQGNPICNDQVVAPLPETITADLPIDLPIADNQADGLGQPQIIPTGLLNSSAMIAGGACSLNPRNVNREFLNWGMLGLFLMITALVGIRVRLNLT